MPPILRPAQPTDFLALVELLHALNYTHRHLDWRDTLDWLGREAFWVYEENDELIGALACPPDPPEVAWVRLFAINTRTSPDRTWQKLFAPVLEDLHSPSNRGEEPVIVSLSLREWYKDLLVRNHFTHFQDIVVFQYSDTPPAPAHIDPPIQIRTLRPEDDLEAVAQIDHMAFESIWRLSPNDLGFAAKKSTYCTVAESNGQIIGYTMSSSNGMYGHLARLAVHPSYQGQKIGYALVQDLLVHFLVRNSFWGVTLNTQSTNQASLALYHKLGFRETGEGFPVYQYQP